jgi:hypothetical protein
MQAQVHYLEGDAEMSECEHTEINRYHDRTRGDFWMCRECETWFVPADAFGPLKPPSKQAREVFAKVIENDPNADMRAIPNQWLLNERGISQMFSERISTLESRLKLKVGRPK